MHVSWQMQKLLFGILLVVLKRYQPTLIRSPDVLRTTAAFEMAMIFPMTSTFKKDKECKS